MAKEADRLNRVVSELLELVKPTHLALQAVELNTLINHSLQLVSGTLRVVRYSCALTLTTGCRKFRPTRTD